MASNLFFQIDWTADINVPERLNNLKNLLSSYDDLVRSDADLLLKISCVLLNECQQKETLLTRAYEIDINTTNEDWRTQRIEVKDNIFSIEYGHEIYILTDVDVEEVKASKWWKMIDKY